MQTAAIRPSGNLTDDIDQRRDAYTTGVDFDMNFHDRDYNVQGSFVGSIVQPSTSFGASQPSKIYGTGGAAELLGVKPTTLVSRIQKMGLKKHTERGEGKG